jgi:hypothetical protein
MKLFLAIDHFLPNFAQIAQFLLPLFLPKFGHLIQHSIPNLMLNSNLFTEFTFAFRMNIFKF